MDEHPKYTDTPLILMFLRYTILRVIRTGIISLWLFLHYIRKFFRRGDLYER